ncbi:MAG TPA: hypothetical protein VNX88_00915, partial [Terriglobales bacterium]|nr:hypothetical protein [Terriglobales bacterium]
MRLSSSTSDSPSGYLHPSNRNSGARRHPRLGRGGPIREPWCWGPRLPPPVLTSAQSALSIQEYQT